MKWSLYVLIAFLFSVPAAHANTLDPSNSNKDIEVKVAKLLKDNLKVEASLKVTDDKGEDLRVVTLFGEDKKKKLPKIAAFVDTQVLKRDKSGKVLAQAISIFSSAEISVKSKDRLKLLEWVNSWNSNALPFRIQVVENVIVVATNLVTTISNPVSEEVILASYLGIIQVWPGIIESLGKSNLLQE